MRVSRRPRREALCEGRSRGSSEGGRCRGRSATPRAERTQSSDSASTVRSGQSSSRALREICSGATRTIGRDRPRERDGVGEMNREALDEVRVIHASPHGARARLVTSSSSRPIRGPARPLPCFAPGGARTPDRARRRGAPMHGTLEPRAPSRAPRPGLRRARSAFVPTDRAKEDRSLPSHHRHSMEHGLRPARPVDAQALDADDRAVGGDELALIPRKGLHPRRSCRARDAPAAQGSLPPRTGHARAGIRAQRALPRREARRKPPSVQSFGSRERGEDGGLACPPEERLEWEGAPRRADHRQRLGVVKPGGRGLLREVSVRLTATSRAPTSAPTRNAAACTEGRVLRDRQRHRVAAGPPTGRSSLVPRSGRAERRIRAEHPRNGGERLGVRSKPADRAYEIAGQDCHDALSPSSFERRSF